MKYLNTLLENTTIDDQIKESVIQMYLETKERLKLIQVHFDEDAELMFSNHLLALSKRIKTQSFVDPIDEEMMSDIPEKAWELAEVLINNIFHEQGIPVNRSELFLVATHIGVALEKEGRDE